MSQPNARALVVPVCVSSGQVSRSNGTGVVGQFGDPKFWLGSESLRRNMLLKGIPNGAQEVFTSNRNSATDDKNLRV
jgi:hypothetical protein